MEYLTKISFATSFIIIIYPLACFSPLEHFLSCTQRDLRMFVIHKLCGVGNEFEKKLKESYFVNLLLK